MYDWKYGDLSFMTKYDRLLSFDHRLNNFRHFSPPKAKTKIYKSI